MSSRVPPGLLLQMAARSILAHRTKSLFVGGILMFGTALVVVGSALLGSVEEAMAQSVTSSLSGQLQVYSSEAEDPLELFGGFGMGRTDIGEIPDFGEADGALSAVDGVTGVVPMGITAATVFTRTELDQSLEGLRAALRDGDADAAQGASDQIRRIAATFQREATARAAITADPEGLARDQEALDTVLTDAFWAPVLAPPTGDGPSADAMAALDYLDTRVAPQAADGRLLYLRAIGTDLDTFASSFERFYVVDGQMVPRGQRGFLFSKRTYERLVKHKVARELDAIYEAVNKDRERIADSPLLQEQIGRLSRQYQRILFQLRPADLTDVEAALRGALAGVEGGLEDLVQQFLLVDDSTLEARYKLFYDVIAPRIQLYEVPVGSVITLRAFTRSGYLKAVNVRVWGTYEFRGLEESDLASASNLTDLVTFRELYGKMTDEQKAELAELRASVGVQDVSREDAEAALFGGGGDLVAEAPDVAEDTAPTRVEELATTAPLDDRVYAPSEMRDGLALNAAVLVDDEADLARVTRDLQAAIDDAGLKLQIVSWQAASGLLGQFILVMRLVLIVSLTIIFIVALIIINNAMVMATMDRVPEIGTMRAIGARKALVATLLLAETLLLSAVAGAAGAAVGAAFVGWLGQIGIPAVEDVLVILFAGPRLYPSVGIDDLAFAGASVVAVALLSTFYPALLAMRVQPVTAMQGKE